VSSTGGQLFDVFTKEEVDSWVEILKKAPPMLIRGNDCHGVDENHIMNPWFQKIIFSRIKNLLGQDLNLVFAMLLNENAPWSIHTDSYHCDGFENRIPALSILIPYSVDNDTSLVDCVRTIVFNERSNNNKTVLQELVDDKTDNINSASKIYEEHLSHNKIEFVNKLTVQGIYQWKANSLIYWDSFYLHDTDNFHKNGFKNKQAIVIHTYRQK
jgi:hypothetical protein